MLGAGGANPIAGWGLKPPSGAGLSIDAGVVKGGGFLLFDAARGEYGGILDIKLMQIGVKAIGLLSTKNPGGWSLLLVITAQLPPIQLGFGFTMTGIGGLLGVQHTIDTEALSSGLSTGSLDSFLFPQNPIANAPQIINQLRTIFPFKAGGFVIGPMLELGWGTPSLVTARIGVLIEPSQIVIVGQVIVQLPPLVDKSLALLYLQMDYRGRRGVRPAQVLARRRAARFARALHLADRTVRVPRAVRRQAELPDQRRRLPPALHRHPARHPRARSSASARSSRIGIVGMQLRRLLRGHLGHRAGRLVDARVGRRRHRQRSKAASSSTRSSTSSRSSASRSTSTSGPASRSSASTSPASTSTACSPGPGRWHIVGRATIHTPWPLPDFGFNVDETWGEDRDTTGAPAHAGRTSCSKELEARTSKGGRSTGRQCWRRLRHGFATLPPPAAADAPALLAHPNAVLQFVQKRMPLAKRSTSSARMAIEGEKQIAIDNARLRRHREARPTASSTTTSRSRSSSS